MALSTDLSPANEPCGLMSAAEADLPSMPSIPGPDPANIEVIEFCCSVACCGARFLPLKPPLKLPDRIRNLRWEPLSSVSSALLTIFGAASVTSAPEGAMVDTRRTPDGKKDMAHSRSSAAGGGAQNHRAARKKTTRGTKGGAMKFGVLCMFLFQTSRATD